MCLHAGCPGCSYYSGCCCGKGPRKVADLTYRVSETLSRTSFSSSGDRRPACRQRPWHHDRHQNDHCSNYETPFCRRQPRRVCKERRHREFGAHRRLCRGIVGGSQARSVRPEPLSSLPGRCGCNTKDLCRKSFRFQGRLLLCV